MGSRKDLVRTLVISGVLVASFAGCLVVSPLKEQPEHSAVSGNTSDAGKGASAGNAGQPSTGGSTGGSGSGNGCQTNEDCKPGGADAPYRCRPSDRTCVKLTSDDCPVVFGPADDPNAIYFGAFATVNPLAPDRNTIFWAHELARDQLSGDLVGGLPGGPGGATRPLVMIGCNNADASIEPALEHLMNNVEVPALLATLKPGDLRRAFEDYRSRNVFYLSPVAVTSTVIQQEDDGLIWNMLGQPADLAPAYGELLRLSEQYVRNTQAIAKPAPIRVALVTTLDAFDSELADSVRAVLDFNGAGWEDNDADGNYLDVTINPDDDLEELGTTIAEFRPHIVVSAASDPFTRPGGLIDQIEIPWDDVAADAMQRPFYILSPYNAGDLGSLQSYLDLQLASSETNTTYTRFIGVSIAGPEDISLDNIYRNLLHSRFPEAYPDSANYYEAVYYMAYAMVASSDTGTLTGPGIADGMQRLLSGESFDVGKASITDVLDALEVQDATIQLNSALGPPTFDATTGIRPVNASVFCFDKLGPSSTEREIDVMRFDRVTGTFSGSLDECFSGFFP